MCFLCFIIVLFNPSKNGLSLKSSSCILECTTTTGMVWNEKTTVNFKIKVLKIENFHENCCVLCPSSFPKMHGSSSGMLRWSTCWFRVASFIPWKARAQLDSRVFWGPGYWWLGMVKPLSQILHVRYIYCTTDSVAIKTCLDISNLQSEKPMSRDTEEAGFEEESVYGFDI